MTDGDGRAVTDGSGRAVTDDSGHAVTDDGGRAVADGGGRPVADEGERSSNDGETRSSTDAEERPSNEGGERSSTDGEVRSSTDGGERSSTDGGDRSTADDGDGSEREQRNVVLVTVDSLRADHCSFMGYEEETTPTLDAMAEDGVAFENAVSPGPSTYDSMPAIFTGSRMVPLSPPGTGDGDSLDRRGRNISLNMQTGTIAEWFDEQGYETAAFTTNPYTGEHTAFGRGFDHFEDFLDGGEGPLMRKAAHLPVLSELKHLVTLVRGDRASKNWTDYVDDVLAWADDAEEPYFLWIFLLDTHTPYLVPEEYRTECGPLSMYYHNWRLWMAKKWLDSDGASLDRDRLVGLYDDAARSVDGFVERLQTDLADADPAIVVHADHGEAFGEHGSYGHESTLYEENVHVPLVVGGAEESARPAEPVSLADLPELLQAVARGDRRPSDVVADSAPAVATNEAGDRVAVRGPDWKYVADVDPDGGIGEEAVHDLADDAAEQRDVAADRPELVAACRDRVASFRDHLAEKAAISRVADDAFDADAATERRL